VRISLRSMLIAGVSTLAVTSLAVAPVRVTPPEPVAQVSAPVHLAAAVAPIQPPTPRDLSSALVEINQITSQFDVPLAAADVTVQNAASDFVTWLYDGILYWTDYLALELAPYVLQFLPGGWLITNQIYAIYPPIVDFTDSIVFDLINPVLNDPLNLQVWANGIGAVAYTGLASLINVAINEINLVIDYFLSWIPPLPPLPPWPFSLSTEATLATAATPQAAVPGLVAGPIEAVSGVVAGLAHSAVNLWYPPSDLIGSGVGIASDLLDGFSWLPLVGVADFQLTEIWGLIKAEGDTFAGFAHDLISIANSLVANTLEDGILPAAEDAFYTALLSVQNRGDAAVDAARNFTLDQLQYLTGVWLPHTTNPNVDLPQGPPNETRFSAPQVLRDILGPFSSLIPSGTLGSLPVNTAEAAPSESEGGDAVVLDEKSAPAVAEPTGSDSDSTDTSTDSDPDETTTVSDEENSDEETSAADDSGESDEKDRTTKRSQREDTGERTRQDTKADRDTAESDKPSDKPSSEKTEPSGSDASANSDD